jgi:hypothetical protein
MMISQPIIFTGWILFSSEAVAKLAPVEVKDFRQGGA